MWRWCATTPMAALTRASTATASCRRRSARATMPAQTSRSRPTAKSSSVGKRLRSVQRLRLVRYTRTAASIRPSTAAATWWCRSKRARQPVQRRRPPGGRQDRGQRVPSNGSNDDFGVARILGDPVCGDAVVGSGEQCDDGNTLNGDCCSSTCQYEANSVVCRAAAGGCDLAEHCSGSSGTCPADIKSTAVCRTSAGACDVAESCNGVNNTCPADGFASSGVCRPAAVSATWRRAATAAGRIARPTPT